MKCSLLGTKSNQRHFNTLEGSYAMRYANVILMVLRVNFSLALCCLQDPIQIYISEQVPHKKVDD